MMTHEQDIIYRIIEQWPNALSSMAKMELWLQEYAIDQQLRLDQNRTFWKVIDNALYQAFSDAGLANAASKTESLVSKLREDIQAGKYLVNYSNIDLNTFQERADEWVVKCFGTQARNVEERNYRFLEEALELVQACGCTREDVLQLVDYTFSRPIGDKYEEVGQVMVTLAALCLANQLNMHLAGENELTRIWSRIESIRQKHTTRPKNSPLPVKLDENKRSKLNFDPILTGWVDINHRLPPANWTCIKVLYSDSSEGVCGYDGSLQSFVNHENIKSITHYKHCDL